jgi:tetratricopeptide (TPR) repeat protein
VSPVDGQRRIIDGGRIIAPADLQDELFVALRRKQRKRLIAEQRLDEDIKLRGPHCDEGGHADDKIIYRTNIPSHTCILHGRKWSIEASCEMVSVRCAFAEKLSVVGYCLHRFGRPEEALRLLLAACELAPSKPHVLLLMARLQAKAGNLNAAKDLLNQIGELELTEQQSAHMLLLQRALSNAPAELEQWLSPLAEMNAWIALIPDSYARTLAQRTSSTDTELHEVAHGAGGLSSPNLSRVAACLAEDSKVAKSAPTARGVAG